MKTLILIAMLLSVTTVAVAGPASGKKYTEVEMNAKAAEFDAKFAATKDVELKAAIMGRMTIETEWGIKVRELEELKPKMEAAIVEMYAKINATKDVELAVITMEVYAMAEKNGSRIVDTNAKKLSVAEKAGAQLAKDNYACLLEYRTSAPVIQAPLGSSMEAVGVQGLFEEKRELKYVRACMGSKGWTFPER